MAYLRPFHRLVMIGDMYQDKFNVTLSIGSAGVDAPAVTDTLLASVAGVVSTWWPKAPGASLGIGISSAAKLTSIKLNRINTAGHYQDAEAKEYIYPGAIAGTGTAGVPPQLSLVVSLRGAAPRSHGGKGRMYFPPTTGTNTGLDSATGQITVALATNHANGIASLLTSIASAYVSAGITAVPGIASAAGAGAFQAVDYVHVGRVVDTMRSRRNKLLEAPVIVDVT